MIRERHVAHVERKRNAYRILVRKPEGKYHLLKLGVDGKIIVQWTLHK
jgi:hypothetical protein